MSEDDIIRVFSSLKKELNTRKNLKIDKGMLLVYYRSLTNNYSGSSFREFIINSKALGILKVLRNKIIIFIPEKFEEYIKLKKRLGETE